MSLVNLLRLELIMSQLIGAYHKVAIMTREVNEARAAAYACDSIRRANKLKNFKNTPRLVKKSK